MSDQTVFGGCQCGEIRYQLVGEPLMTALCHCAMCRRAHSAPAVAWAMYSAEQFSLTGASLNQYASSDDAERGFCGNCGTQITFTADFLPGLVDVAIGSLDMPNEVPVQMHIWHSKHLSWFEVSDQLPRHQELPPIAE